MAKKVKVKSEPNPRKQPVLRESPDLFRKCKASWQLGSIDVESKWGKYYWDGKYKFVLDDDKIEEIEENLALAVISLNGNLFDSHDHFIRCLSMGTEEDVKVKSLGLLVSFLKRESLFWDKIYPKLKEYEKRTWDEIDSESYSGSGGKRKSKHHFVSFEKFIREAQKRLIDLKLDDHDSLFSFRLDSTLRLYGFRDQGHFRILWIDPNHEIVPSKKS